MRKPMLKDVGSSSANYKSKFSWKVQSMWPREGSDHADKFTFPMIGGHFTSQWKKKGWSFIIFIFSQPSMHWRFSFLLAADIDFILPHTLGSNQLSASVSMCHGCLESLMWDFSGTDRISNRTLNISPPSDVALYFLFTPPARFCFCSTLTTFFCCACICSRGNGCQTWHPKQQSGNLPIKKVTLITQCIPSTLKILLSKLTKLQ